MVMILMFCDTPRTVEFVGVLSPLVNVFLFFSLDPALICKANQLFAFTGQLESVWGSSVSALCEHVPDEQITVLLMQQKWSLGNILIFIARFLRGRFPCLPHFHGAKGTPIGAVGPDDPQLERGGVGAFLSFRQKNANGPEVVRILFVSSSGFVIYSLQMNMEPRAGVRPFKKSANLGSLLDKETPI